MVIRYILIFSATLFTLVATIFIVLFIISPGKPKVLTDNKGNYLKTSISEKIHVQIGGISQGMFVRSKNIENPVLLFVHGGPCFSEYFLVEKNPTGLEDYFTVCYWEQRGCGISYTQEISLESITLKQMSNDLIDVTNYLRRRFKKKKIYILAHSGGTAFAIRTVSENPELYNAYIGVAQITSQAESEKHSYQYMVDEYSSRGDSAKLKEFKKYPILNDDNYLPSYFGSRLRDESMHELGIGTMRRMKSVISGVFLPVWGCRAYTLKEKFNIWKSKLTFINKSTIKEQILNLDLPSEISRIDIPVYFFSGRYDMTVNKDLSSSFLQSIQAPVKGFYTFKKSAHSPMFEESGRFLMIMTRDVLNKTVNLADKQQKI
ncbi:MAG: alpha/beta hydrolase [Rikenellaceae bacterium]|nr:alpha/beta hydrolase [Rikenellaceae bacterium]